MKSQNAQILCEYAELLAPNKLVPNPKNRNTHPPEQIDRLAKLIEGHGFRHPIIVSKRSGFVVAGHGRLEAAKRLKLKSVPVDYQDFDDDDAEYAFLVSDNAIASWAELDLSGINSDLADLGPEFDLNMLGMKEFTLVAPEFEPGTEEDQGKLDQKKPVQCPNCGECFVAKS